MLSLPIRAVIALSFLFLPLIRAQFVSSLPQCVQNCIEQSTDDNCEIADIKCLCRASAGNFLPDLIICMHGGCDNDLDNNLLLTSLQLACVIAGTPIPDSAIRNAENEASSLATQVICHGRSWSYNYRRPRLNRDRDNHAIWDDDLRNLSHYGRQHDHNHRANFDKNHFEDLRSRHLCHLHHYQLSGANSHVATFLDFGQFSYEPRFFIFEYGGWEQRYNDYDECSCSGDEFE